MLRIDHVVLGVRDLGVAAERLRGELGLDSLPGGRHPGWGTGNRIVPLGRDYVELLAVVDPDEAASSPVGTWIGSSTRGGDRLLAWCVSTDDVDRVAARLGLGAVPGARALPDGRSITWRSAGLDRVPEHPELPFFITWDVPPELHPGRARAEHPIEPGGIAWIELAADEARLNEWLGGEGLPVRVVEGPPGLRAVGIATTDGEIVLR